MKGYAGKILRVNLSRRKISTIPTEKYEKWIGGHGMGSAIFFDLVKDKTIDGFHPDNVITLMTSPLCGTLAPAGAGRTEVQGIGIQSIPIGWFTRSNFGGRFSTQMKFAGWDGIVIEGKADQPVWLDIRNDSVTIRNCKDLSLWGTTTRRCQEIIWKYVAGGKIYGDWMNPSGGNGGQTTQRPAILTIGPAGENRSRMACLIHDAGNAAGQGGFGGVYGPFKLKIFSFLNI
jgi:aldehyde:ferredoxin oxidoreductase